MATATDGFGDFRIHKRISYERQRPSRSDQRARNSRNDTFDFSEDDRSRNYRTGQSHQPQSPPVSSHAAIPDHVFYRSASSRRRRKKRTVSHNDSSDDSEANSTFDEAQNDERHGRENSYANTGQDFEAPLFHQRRVTDLGRYDRKLEQQYGLTSIFRVNVLSASRYWNGCDTYGIDLDYARSGERVPGSQLRWIHCQSERKNLDEFMCLLPQLSSLSDEEIALATHILQDIKQRHRQAYPSDSQLDQIAVKRVAQEFDHHTPILTLSDVTFVNIPYLTIQDHTRKQNKEPASFYPQTLTQFEYPRQSVEDSTRQQALNKTNQIPASQSIHATSLWAVLTYSGLLITLSSDRFESLHRPSVRSRKVDPDNFNIASRKVRVKDWDGKTFHFPLLRCDTYFALSRAVSVARDENKHETNEHYVIYGTDGLEIFPEEWQNYCSKQKGLFVDIRITRAFYSQPKPRIQMSTQSQAGLVLSTSLSKTGPNLKTTSKERRRHASQQRGYYQSSTSSIIVVGSDSSGSAVGSGTSASVSHPLSAEQIDAPITGEMTGIVNKQELVLYSPSAPEDKSHSQRDEAFINTDAKFDSERKRHSSPPLDTSTNANALVRSAVTAPERIEGTPRLPLNRMRRSSPALLADRFVTVPDRRRSPRRHRSGPDDRGRQPANSPRKRQPSRSHGRSEYPDRRSTSRQKQRKNHGLSAAKSLEPMNVPPFLLWPLQEDSEEMQGSVDVYDEQQATGINATNTSMREGDQQSSQLPECTIRILADIESSIRHEHQSCGGLSREQNKLIAEIYENVQDLPSNSTIEPEYNAWLDVYKNDTAIFRKTEQYSWQDLLSRICRSWEALSRQFSPDVSGHSLTTKLVACRVALLRQIRSVCEPQQKWSDMASEHEAHPQSTKYFIFDASTVFDSVANGSLPTAAPFTRCKACLSRKAYGRSFPSPSDAKVHLLVSHFPNQTMSEEYLMRYIVPQHMLAHFQRCAAAIRLMTAILDNLTEMEKLILDIHRGVTVKEKFQTSVYRLPSKLVEVYRHFARNMFFSLHMANTLNEIQDSRREPITDTDFRDIVNSGYHIENLLNEAKTQLTLMNGGNYSNVMTYESVRPTYLLTILMRDLSDRIVDCGGVDIIKAYTAYVRHLEYRVLHHPRRRLRSDIIRCKDELVAMGRTLQAQRYLLEDFEDLPEPIRKHSSNFDHKSAKMTEREASDQFRKTICSRDRQLLGLYERLRKLEQDLIRAIEIEQDDHGKAILVFTMVTVIFLPLSFATSFLGMNTIDIRQTSSGQGLFWAISVPLTFITVIMAVGIGYYGEEIRDQLSAVYQHITSKLKTRSKSDDDYHVSKTHKSPANGEAQV